MPPATLLLDFVRYHKNLTGTKIGCREGDCGACTILTGEIHEGKLRYRSATSCLMPIANAQGKHIVSIEGINTEGLNFLQQTFAEEGATQCGFCTPGFMVSLAGFCAAKNAATREAAIDAVNGNICRCTGYKSIERAAYKIADKLKQRKENDPISFAVENNMLPAYFNGIQKKLSALSLPSNGLQKEKESAPACMGGGTDLYVQQHEGLHHLSLDFLFDKTHLKGIVQQGSKCVMGASVTATDIQESPVFQDHFPQLAKFIKLVSSTPIRNMATIAGNLANASPIGDFTIFLLALDAQLVLTDGETKREIPLRKFYKSYKQVDIHPGEYVAQIYFELPSPGTKFNFEKVCKRTHLDIASVNSAISLKMDENNIVSAAISAGGVGPVPAYLAKGSALLAGKNISPELIEALIDMVQQEISPISDPRGTAMYKRFLLGQLIKAHFMELFPELDCEKILSAKTIL